MEKDNFSNNNMNLINNEKPKQFRSDLNNINKNNRKEHLKINGAIGTYNIPKGEKEIYRQKIKSQENRIKKINQNIENKKQRNKLDNNKIEKNRINNRPLVNNNRQSQRLFSSDFKRNNENYRQKVQINNIIEPKNLAKNNLNNHINNLQNNFRNNNIKENKEFNQNPLKLNNNNYNSNHQVENFRNKLNEKDKKIYLLEKRIKELEGIEEKIIAVKIVSVDQVINCAMKCKKSDVFSKIEKELYRDYPDYKKQKVFFTANGKKIDENKTMDENGIKNGTSIVLNLNLI